ncbi:MAG: chromosomal replication initiator protein DnaA [Bacteroidales bacterium]|nr:MAG: chromosomal replication initiator protein DnaA [Bacteroidales bacterium]
MVEVINLWNKCLNVIRDNVSSNIFDTWFKPIVPLDYKGDEFVLQLPSNFFYEYIEEHYSDILIKAINKVVGKEVNLLYRVVVDMENGGSTDMPTTKPTRSHTLQKRFVSPFDSVVNIDFDSQLNDIYTFDNFIEGKNNKLVRTAGLNIAQNPGKTLFNPLFIYGRSGVGKTHISNAIGKEIKAKFPNKRVLYVSANLFQLQYTDAALTNNQNDFLNFYQSLDVLIIDDIQDFATKKGTQNTFFNIFNHLHRLGKQIIMTSDRQPSELQGLEERLLTRFRWGLSAEITQPDKQLRQDILKHKIKQNGLVISDEVIEYIADNVTQNIRDLEGVILSLLAHSTINDEDISLTLAQKVIGTTPREETTVNIDYICDLVCQHYSVSQDALYSKSRKAEVAQPRQVAMYLARKHTMLSLDAIAMNIGKRTHATVIHSCKQIDNLIKLDKSLQRDISIIEGKIK